MKRMKLLPVAALFALISLLPPAVTAADPPKKPVPSTITVMFPQGTATPSEVCGE